MTNEDDIKFYQTKQLADAKIRGCPESKMGSPLSYSYCTPKSLIQAKVKQYL